jgi:hypothetical protein
MDYGHGLSGLIGGTPVDPFDRQPLLIFGEQGGYINEYESHLLRGAMPPGPPATGTVQAGSGVNLVVTAGGLYTGGDDMAGMRLEVEHTDGTIDIRAVASNTAANIVPDTALSADPTGGTWWVGGIPSYWRSWVDHMGQPTYHKDLIHLFLGHNRESGVSTYLMDVEIAASGEWPVDTTRTRTARLDQYRNKLLAALVGRFFTYEVANSRPDERYMLTTLETNEKILTGRRR